MQFPVVLVFNTLKQFHKQFELSHLRKLMNYLNRELENKKSKLIMMPIINYQKSSIEERSQQIEEEINKILKVESKVHLISTGLAGVDSRSVYNKNKNILSLHTLGSPHKGAFMSEIVSQELIEAKVLSGLQILIGTDLDNLKEFSESNMQQFNLDNPAFRPVYSCGGYQHSNQSNDLLKLTNHYISHNYQHLQHSTNDGIFLTHEVQFDHFIGSYNLDHTQILGYSNVFTHFQHVIDNIQLIETLKSQS